MPAFVLVPSRRGCDILHLMRVRVLPSQITEERKRMVGMVGREDIEPRRG